jgi:tetratricopeptide (TPR) repeat protein
MTQTPGKSGEVDRDVAALRLVQRFQQALQQEDRATIVEALRQLVALCAPMAGQWLQLAPMAADLGEFGLAREAIDLFVESAGGGSTALAHKVDVLAYIGAVGEALALLRTLPPNVPDPFAHALSRGALTTGAGDADEARRWLETALRLRPQSGQAWYLLAMVVDFAKEPDLADGLFAGERAMQAAPRVERAYYYYALGKARADLGEHARAFAAAARANGATRAEYPYDRSVDRQSALEAVKGYDAAGIAGLARRQGEPTDRSIFVMGLPRSGTTLVQQILTSHDEVSGGGEINLLRWLVREAGDASYPAVAAFVGKAGAPPLARLWRHLLEQRFPSAGRVVDKTINTTRKLGFAAALLPEAPLIWLRRDPLDCAWSCFRNCFMENVHWSNDLGDIAFNFRLEDELLERWQAILGERLLVIPFEELVSGPEPWIRRILAHCGLEEQPQVLAPHENRSPVQTVSAMQVRRPINRAGIGSAEPYRPYLAPFIEAYYGERRT